MMDAPTSRDPDALACHPAVKAYSKDVAKRLARAHRARPDGSNTTTEAFLAEIADGLERWQGRDMDGDDPDQAAADAERAAAAGDAAATIDFAGRAMARKGRRVVQEAAEAVTASGAGPLTLFFVEPGTLVTNELLSAAAGYPKGPVLEPGAPMPPGVEPIAGYLVERPEDFDAANRSKYDYISRCLAETFGLHDAAYIGIGASGWEIEKKPRKGIDAKHASGGTSISSKTFRKLVPLKAPFRIWAPTGTGKKFFSGTAHIRGALGGWIPWVGWGLLAMDVIRFGACLEDAGRGMKRPPRRGSR